MIGKDAMKNHKNLQYDDSDTGDWLFDEEERLSQKRNTVMQMPLVRNDIKRYYAKEYSSKESENIKPRTRPPRANLRMIRGNTHD